MDDKEQNKFSLEDILKEFGVEADTPPEKMSSDEENVRIADVPSAERASSEKPAFTADTVRLNAITEAVRQQTAGGDTVRFQPVGQAEELPPVERPREETVEPFSEQWEPEYEQPMGEYIPPQPIVFHPKSRLNELKRKLVEGPERRYYELEEQGFGKLQSAIFISLITSAVTIISSVLYRFEMVGAGRLRLMIFGQVLMMLLSALVGSYQLLEGFGDMLRKRFTMNTLLVFGFIACCMDGVLCLRRKEVPCCGVFCLQITMSLWASYQKRRTELLQMDTIRKATRLDSVTLSENYYEERPGYVRGEGQVEDFMDNYAQPSKPERIIRWYALVVLFVSLICGVVAGVLESLHTGVRVFSVALLVGLPISTHVCLTRPMALLQRRLHKHGSVICGWQGVVGLSRPAAFPLTDRDLFPSGSVKLNGVKFYGVREPDEVVAYAAAVICADGGSLAELMSGLLESRNGHHYDAESLQSYPGGIGGVVNDEAVLAGSLGFLQSMGVEMPNGTKVNQAVYVAIDGQLCGVFAVSYTKVKSAAVGLHTLCAYRGLTPVLTAGDFMLTEGFLRGKFGVNTRRMAFPARNIRGELNRRTPEEDAPTLALTTQEGVAGAAYAVTGARALRSSCILGTVIHMIAGILGLLIVVALVAVHRVDLLNAYNILLYQFLWTIPGLLITEWTRSI